MPEVPLPAAGHNGGATPAKTLEALRRLWWALPVVLFAVLMLAACARGAPPPAGSLVLSQHWRLDSSGQETLKDAQQAHDWRPLADWQSWGFGPETVWIKIRLQAAAPGADSPWVVRVRPPFLDHLTLHDPATGQRWHTGDALPTDRDSLPAVHFMLQIPALPHERTLYLQMRSSSARTIQVEVLPFGQAQRLNRWQEWVMGLVTAASAVFACWAAAQWWARREPVIGAFALKQVMATAWAFIHLGFARVVIGPWLPEGLLTFIATTLNIWLIAITLWFFTVLLRGYQPARAALRACQVLAAMIGTLPVWHWLGHPQLALVMANTSVLLAFLLLMGALLSAWPRRPGQPISLSVLLVYLSVYSLLNAWPPLIHLGWVPGSAIVLFGTLAHVVLDGVIMFVMLQVRARVLEDEQIRTAMQWQNTQLVAEAERRHHQDQNRLFAMLAHEIRTPLTTLRMWMEAGPLRREDLLRAIGDMSQVIDRCVHAGQLDDDRLQPHVQPIAPRELTEACVASCRDAQRVQLVAMGGLGPLHSDAQMLSIALGNLLDNACKYSVPGSPIALTLQPAEHQGQTGWRWQVANVAGPGDLPDGARLFEKYYRSPRARRLTGSGLGLFLVKGLVDLMQGSVQFELRSDRVVFSLWLPQRAPPGRPLARAG